MANNRLVSRCKALELWLIYAYGRNKEEAISFDEHINHQVKSLQDEIVTRFINYEAKKIKESKKWLI